MMGANFGDAVFEALSGCLDPAPNVRMAAELQIKHLTANAGACARRLARRALTRFPRVRGRPGSDRSGPERAVGATTTRGSYAEELDG